jgi:hypothetical protein
LEGARTPEQRANDVRLHTLIARVFGVGLIVGGVWLLSGL